MARGRNQVLWKHTSAVLAAVINANPYRKGSPVEPSELDPTVAAAAKPLKVGIDALKVFLPDNAPENKP